MAARYDEKEYSIVEAYKSIRTVITVNEKIKTILITSSEKDEGKTTTTSSLAECFSDLKKSKILLIDGDLRKPSIHKHFDIDNKYGLVDVLNNDKEFHKCIKEKGNLHILTTGSRTKNAAELLDSETMRNFIEEMKETYDYIFVDSPPVSRVNDACIMAKYIDGTLIVSASNEIDRELAKLTRNRLNKVNANIIGVILNKFKAENHAYHGYYGYEDEETNQSIFKLINKLIKRR